MDLGNLNFRHQELIAELVFYFYLQYEEPLRDNFLLLERGNDRQNGNIKIYLSKQGASRVISLEVQGETQNVTWKSRSEMSPKQKNYFFIGVVKSPSNSLHVVYFDSNNTVSKDQLTGSSNFNTLSQTLVLFK